MKALNSLRTAQRAVGHALVSFSHGTLLAIGLVVMAIAAVAVGHVDLRQQAEAVARQWLQSRHEERALQSGDLLAVVGEQDAVWRATASDVKDLPRDQAAVARWIARRYKVALEPISRLVQEAWSVGRLAGIEPTLILAVMAVESSFNPFAQSAVGAQGLMQVMTNVHDDKYVAFGGNHAAFDPVSNLRVGVQVLRDCIRRAGSLHDGLRAYLGAPLLESDSGYVGRVLAVQAQLRQAAGNAPLVMLAQADRKPLLR